MPALLRITENLSVISLIDMQDSWYYTIGCILGNLSVQLFPATNQERQAWEAEYRVWHEKCDRDMAMGHGTEQLDLIPSAAYTI